MLGWVFCQGRLNARCLLPGVPSSPWWA
jgi:hypothetical protein